MDNIYQDHGYNNRKDYLNSLAEDFGLDTDVVYSLASVLGKIEDFDGLVTSLEDIEAGDGGWHGGWDGD